MQEQDIKKIKERIINYVYTISTQPILLKDLLEANVLYNEKMYVDPAKLGFRLNLKRAYMVYFAICAIILVPIITISHFLLIDVNFHVSIAGTVLMTSAVFIGFNFFRAWLRDAITLKLIKKAWLVHFPYFPYEKYSKKVAEIYNEARKKELPKKELQQYIMQKILENKE